MAWAMGPAGPGAFPNFRAACQNLQFSVAAAQCQMNEAGNPGLIPRNQANFTLFSNAAVVLASSVSSGFQSANLYYPRQLTAPANGQTSSAPAS
jgi:hypothetical protein